MSIKRKLLVAFMAVALLTAAVGISSIALSRQVFGLRATELPMEQNLREVEVSIWEAIHAANTFRLTGDKMYEDLYYRQVDDVEKFFPKYAELATTDKEKAFIQEFMGLWETAKAAGETMLELTKAEQTQEKLFFEAVDAADDVLDFELQAKWSPRDPQLLEKEQAVREVEVSVWEAIHAAHQHVGLSEHVRRFYNDYAGKEKTVDFSKLMEAQFKDVAEYWPKYKALNLAPWEEAAVARFDRYWADALKTGRRMLTLHEQAQLQFDKLYKNIDEADDVIDFKMQEYIALRISNEDDLASITRNVILAICIGALLLALLGGFYISYAIGAPIRQLTEVANSVSEGDLQQAIEVKSKDELGDLARAFERMMDWTRQMADIARKIAGGDLDQHVAPKSEKDIFGKSFQMMVRNLREIITRIKHSGLRVAAFAEQIRDGAHTQATSFSSKADVAYSAQNVALIAQKTIDGMTEISTKVEQTRAKVLSLGKTSESINNITTLLDDIAGQTKILAINAAIEAEKAGDAGLGFSVVAMEVRSLAEHAARSTAEIRSLIKEMQTGTDIAVSQITDSSLRVADGVKMVNETMDAVKELNQLTQGLEEAISHFQVSEAAPDVAASWG